MTIVVFGVDKIGGARAIRVVTQVVVCRVRKGEDAVGRKTRQTLTVSGSILEEGL